MTHLPFGLKLIFILLIAPVVIGYSMVIGTYKLKHAPLEKKQVLLELEKYKVKGIDTVPELDAFLETELKTFLGSRWLAISIVQVVLAFGLLFRAPWVRIGMIVYLSILILLIISLTLVTPLAKQSFLALKIVSVIAGLCTILYLQHPKIRDEFF